MARQARLAKKRIGKQTYWHTKAGGRDQYFGNVKTVRRKEAEKAFADLRRSQLDDKPKTTVATPRMTCWEVCDRYLAWARGNLSQRNFATKKSMLGQWCNHRVASRELAGTGEVVGDLPAMRITPRHLDEFIAARRNGKKTAAKKKENSSGKGIERSLSPTAVAASMVHIKACWNWAADPRRGGLFSVDHKPFAGIAKVKIPPKPKSEFELPTEDEYEALLEHADADVSKVRAGTGRWRARQPHECRTGKDNPYRGFGEIIRFYYATGPRTGELAALRVRDIHLRTKQVTLGNHKRTHTQDNTTIRDIQLNAEAFEIIKRQIKGKKPSEYVFTQSNGSPWNQDRLDERFREVRKRAGVRDDITIYSFRHLWISDMMEDPEIPIGTIAAMAGTSIEQIQKTYGHFRNQAKAEAQARLDARRRSRKGNKSKT